MTFTVADVMTREVRTVGPSEPVKACAELMRTHGVGAVPVVVGDHVVGIVSEADLMRVIAPARAQSVPQRRTAGEVMTREVVTVSPHASVAAAARVMFDRRVKRLPVIDSGGRLAGIVSRTDILRVFLRTDESIRKEVAHGLLNEFPLLGRGRVEVSVHDGVVRLDGEVETGSLTGLLVRLIAAVPGVAGVENRLRAVPDVCAATANAQPAAAGERRARA